MRRIDSAKRARIEGAFTSFPKLTNSAIAKLTGAHRKTVAKVRILKGIADSQHVEASSRRARGRRQMVMARSSCIASIASKNYCVSAPRWPSSSAWVPMAATRGRDDNHHRHPLP